MESIGTRLRQLRLEKGLSLEDVHKQTKIHLNILKALEEDSLVNFSPIYIKGFLKIYCNFLGIDPKTVISEYKENKNKPEPVTQKEIEKENEKQAKPLPKVLDKKSLTEFGLFKIIRKNIRSIILVIVVLIGALVLFNFSRFVVSKISLGLKKIKSKSSQAALKPKPVKAKPEKKITIAAKPQKAVVEPVVNAEKPRQAEEVISKVRLGVRAKDDCWMQVKADGKTIFQGSLKKGRFENWEAKEKIELSLGNAGVVELEVNNKLISNLGRRGQALKNILITKDGLSTSK